MAHDAAADRGGQRALRREDDRLVHGQGRYVANLRRDGLLEAVFARSMVAHARLFDVDPAPAVDAGAVAAFAATDLDVPDIPASTSPGPAAEGMTRPPLARDRVRYSGEAFAVVLADSLGVANDAVELVGAQFEPMAEVDDPETAEAARPLFDDVGTNLAAEDRLVGGSGAADLDRHDVVVEIEVENQRLAPVPIEPLAILAEPDGHDGVVVHVGHQAPHRLRRQLASLLGLEQSKVRVIVPDVGGAFGHKGMLYPEYAVIAAAARRTGRPVRWVQTRSEQFLTGIHGRAMRHRVRLAGDASGRLRAADIEVLADVGAYPHNGTHVPLNARNLAPGPYELDGLEVRTRMVVTNRAPTGSYRGAGRPEAAYAIERAVDAFARKAGLDPVEVRRRSLLRPEQLPYETLTGALYDSGDYPAALEQVVDMLDLARVREEQAARVRDGGRLLGAGIGMFVERAGGSAASEEYARVSLEPGRGLVARVGSAAAGQGHDTVWSGLVAECFGLAPDQVTVVAGDTGDVAEGTGTFGSRSAQIAGSALQRSARRLREVVEERAAAMLEAAAPDLALRDGHFSVVGDPDAAVTLDALAEAATADGEVLAIEDRFSPGAQTFPYGAVGVVVEVDAATGLVEIADLVAVDDCGVVLHPQIVEGQVVGSLAQGIAQALYEGLEYGDGGQLLTSSLIDYLVPGAPDIPSIRTGRLVSPAPSNPLGAKGSGESGCIGAPPAVVNAVLDALAPLGVTHLDMPLAPQRVWRAIQDAASAPAVVVR